MIRLCVPLVAWFMLAGSAPAQGFPERVGRFGDPALVEIRGAATFEPDEIRAALTGDLSVVVASHPLEVLDDYLRLLARNCERGYLHTGFAHVKVDVYEDADRGRVVVDIVEGQRYVAGQIVVRGNRSIDAKALAAALKEPRRKETDDEEESEDPIWEPGAPASFLADRGSRWKGDVEAILADLGYHNAKFDLVVQPNESDKTADLVVRFSSAGQAARVDAVDIVGLKKNTRDALLERVAWKPGAIITRRELDRITKALWKTGRFLEQQVTLVEPKTDGDAYRLKIEVVEYEPAPRLGQALTEKEMIVLRARDWLANFADHDVDLVGQVRDDNKQYEVIFSAQQGMLMSVTERKSPGGALLPTHALVVSRDTLGYYATTIGQRFAIDRFPGEATLSLSLYGEAPENADDKPFGIKFGAGARYSDEVADKGRLPVKIEAAFDPVFFFGLLYRDGAASKIKDGKRLVVEHEDMTWQFDIASGRLISVIDESNDEASAVRITTETGYYDRRWTEVSAATGDTRNRYKPDQPVTSILQFATDPHVGRDLLHVLGVTGLVETPAGEKGKTSLARIRRFVELGALRPLDELVVSEIRDADDSFSIPVDLTGHTADAAGLAVMIGNVACPLADTLFSRGTWPHTLWQQSCLALAGHRRRASEELERMYRGGRHGPLAYLTTSAVLTKASGNLSKAFARRGLSRLSLAAFQNEYEILLDRKQVAGACVYYAAELLSKMSDEEAYALGDAFHAWHKAVRDEGTTLDDEHVRRLLDIAWTEGLRDEVQTALERLAK